MRAAGKRMGIQANEQRNKQPLDSGDAKKIVDQRETTATTSAQRGARKTTPPQKQYENGTRFPTASKYFIYSA